METIIVTGGAGFIGSAVVRRLIADGRHRVVTLDVLTYAASEATLAAVVDSPQHTLERVDITDAVEVSRVLAAHRPCAVLHLAAESHVDRSIDHALTFVETNVMGTATLLEAARAHWRSLPADRAAAFRFVHVSTDEVFGSLGSTGAFDEGSRYDPNSPYAASKAAADHLARAWHRTYGLPVIVTNCSNNYGPFQFPEKLIPLTILRALAGRELPVYGQGTNVRDWLHVEDHVDGLLAVLDRGVPGATYCFGGGTELRNIDLVHRICAEVDRLAPDAACPDRRSLIRFVTDRPGHDQRYAIDATHAREALGWRPSRAFDAALADTVRWYAENRAWVGTLAASGYQLERLGLRAVA